MKASNKDKFTGTVADFIHEGRENSTHMQDLKKIIGTDERTIRKKIEQLREAGARIIGDDSGYYFPADDQEVLYYIRRMGKKKRTAENTMKPFTQYYEEHHDEI